MFVKKLEYFHVTYGHLSTLDEAELYKLIFIILALFAFTFREIPVIF